MSGTHINLICELYENFLSLFWLDWFGTSSWLILAAYSFPWLHVWANENDWKKSILTESYSLGNKSKIFIPI
jgi:hypothetical protein